MPNSNVRFYKEDITARGVHISLGLISGEYVLLQKHVETVKIRRAFKLKVVIVRKSKNYCTDIELFLHNYIMPFCHYPTPRIFSSSFISWRKATVWKSMNWDTRWYFFKDMYILACECSSLFGEIQCSLMKEMTNMWVAHKKDVSGDKPNHDSLLLLRKLLFHIPLINNFNRRCWQCFWLFLLLWSSPSHCQRGWKIVHCNESCCLLFSFNWKTDN